jgi:F-type H+-transporting ATPase subunit epsilon
MAGLTLRIITPDRVVLDEVVDSVRVPASDGSMGIFPKHAGAVTTLDAGELRYAAAGGELSIFVSGGFAEVRGDTVRVLTSAGEAPTEIDEERAKAAEKRARERLDMSRGSARLDALDTARARASLQRAMARIKMRSRYSS